MEEQINLATRVDIHIAEELDALIPVLQHDVPYARFTRSDAVRACLLVGLKTIKEQSYENLRKPKGGRGAVPPGPRRDPSQIPAPDPGTLRCKRGHSPERYNTEGRFCRECKKEESRKRRARLKTG